MDRVDNRLLIIVPVLRRPHKVQPLLDSIAAATPQPYRVVFVADPDDRPEIEAIKQADGEVWVKDGNYAAKINAVCTYSDEPYIFLGADDLEFHQGWLEAALRKMRGNIGVVGTNDLGNKRVMRGQHATHSLVARWYADGGTIDDKTKLLHEEYPHEYVDDEFVQTAKKRRAFAFARDSVVEHMHPAWNKGDWDDLYRAQRQRMKVGHKIYLQRRHLWR